MCSFQFGLYLSLCSLCFLILDTVRRAHNAVTQAVRPVISLCCCHFKPWPQTVQEATVGCVKQVDTTWCAAVFSVEVASRRFCTLSFTCGHCQSRKPVAVFKKSHFVIVYMFAKYLPIFTICSKISNSMLIKYDLTALLHYLVKYHPVSYTHLTLPTNREV